MALSGAKLAQQELAAQMKAAENPSKRLSNAYEKAKLKTAQLSAEYQRQTNRLQSVEKRLESAGLDANKFAASQAKLERSTEKANAALTAQRIRLKSLEMLKLRCRLIVQRDQNCVGSVRNLLWVI